MVYQKKKKISQSFLDYVSIYLWFVLSVVVEYYSPIGSIWDEAKISIWVQSLGFENICFTSFINHIIIFFLNLNVTLYWISNILQKATLNLCLNWTHIS